MEQVRATIRSQQPTHPRWHLTPTEIGLCLSRTVETGERSGCGGHGAVAYFTVPQLSAQSPLSASNRPPVVCNRQNSSPRAPFQPPVTSSIAPSASCPIKHIPDHRKGQRKGANVQDLASLPSNEFISCSRTMWVSPERRQIDKTGCGTGAAFGAVHAWGGPGHRMTSFLQTNGCTTLLRRVSQQR